MIKILKNKKGFTLIELMIVVAIIGILSAVAIPNFISFRYKAKGSEAKANLGAIRTCEEAYRTEFDTYKTCEACPSTWVAGVLRKATMLWDDPSGDFVAIGFDPGLKVYYMYEVAATGTTFDITATGDVDGDGTVATFTMDEEATLTAQTGEY